MISHNAFAASLITSIPVGGNPVGIAVNPNTNMIYVGVGQTSNGNVVEVIDGATNNVVTTVQAGVNVVTVNPATNMIYTSTGGAIYAINGSTNQVVKTGGAEFTINDMKINPATNKIYAVGYSYACNPNCAPTGNLAVINATTMQITKSMIVTRDTLEGVAIDSDTNNVYLSDGNIYVLNGTSDTITGTIGTTNAAIIAVNPVTQRLYAPYGTYGTMAIADLTNNSVLNTITTGGGLWPVDVNTKTNMIYAGLYSTTGGVTVVNGSTNTVSQNISNGKYTIGIAVNPNTNRIYATNQQSYTVSVIDGNSSSGTSGNITVPSAPQNLQAISNNAQVSLSWSAPSSNGGSSITNYNVYRGTSSDSETLLTKIGNVTSYNDTAVTNDQKYFYKITAVNSIGESSSSNEVSATMPSTSGDEVVSTIPLGNQIPSSIDMNPNTGKIFVGSWLYSFSTPSCYAPNNKVIVINGTSNSVLGNVTVGNSPAGVGVNPKTNMVYVANSGVSVINDTTDTVVSTIPVANPMGVGVNPVTNMIYVSNYGGEIDAINGTTDTVTSTVSVGGHPRSVEVNTNTDKIYVADDSGIQVIDGSTDTIQGTIPVGNDLSGIAVDPSTDKIYVTVGNSVSVIDGTTDTVVGTIPVGNSPGGIGVNPVTNKIYVANTGDNSVSIISGTTNQVINTLSVGSLPVAVAVNPDTNTIYVANGRTDFCPPRPSSVSVIQGSSSITSVPSAPQNLQATTGNNAQITLSWTAPASNGGSAVTGYMIERSADSGTTWSTIVSNTGSTTTTYSDTGLAASTTYTYRVSAINSVGMGSPSNTASATTSATIITKGIALSNTQSTSGTVSSSNTITISSFNVGSDNNRLLVVGVSANNNDVASITFDGVLLKKMAYSFYNNDAEFWYLTNPTGTGDITVTMNGPTQAVVGAYAFSGVNQTTPIPTHVVKHNTSPTSPKISITTKYANDWVLDLPSIYGGSTLSSPTCTQQWDVNVPNAITGASSSTMVQSPGAVTCGWTASSADLYDDAAVEINAASR